MNIFAAALLMFFSRFSGLAFTSRSLLAMASHRYASAFLLIELWRLGS